MANDDKTRPPEPRPPARGQLGSAPAAPAYEEESDWEREVAAWDPSFSPGTPPPVTLGPEPPPPESAELVLDDLNSGEIVLAPGDTPPPELPLAETPQPILGPAPMLRDLYGDEAEVTVVAPPPGAAPENTYPTGEESSGVLVIPEIAELEAAAAGAPLGEPGPADLPPPVASLPLVPMAPREPGRELNEDGLPDVSALFMGGSEPARPEASRWNRPPPTTGQAFEEALPDEEPITALDMSFPVRPSRPLQEIADAAAAFSGDAAELDEVSALQTQRALYLEQLAALEAKTGGADDEATNRAICWTAVAAGRAAERLGEPEAMTWYERALARDPHHGPALRGQLRLLVQAGALEQARAVTATLARVMPGERMAYELVLEHTRPAGESPSVAGTLEASGGEPDSVGRLLLDCERALARDDRARAAAGLQALAERLPGDLQPAFRAFAAVLFECAGDPAAADGLRRQLTDSDGARSGFAALRAALKLSGAEALERLIQAVQLLPQSPLGAALLRWGARLARTQEQPERARTLLERAQGLGPGLLPLLDVVELTGSWPDGAPLEVLLARLDQASPEEAALSGRRLALRLNRDGRPADALEVVRRTRSRGPTAEPAVLGLLAEGSALPGASRDLRLQALKLWGELDEARSLPATTLRAHLMVRGDDTRGEGIGVLEQAVRSDGQEAGFWWLSWYLRRDGRSARAAEALHLGATIWSRPSLDRLVFALRERAQELDLAGRPENLVAYLPKGPLLPPTPDDPARLVRELLAMEREPREIAEAFQDAAREGSRYRVHEAAGWLIQAGAFAEALSWLQGSAAPVASHAISGLLRRRLIGLIDDPTVRIGVLAELRRSNPAGDEPTELEFRRAEALEVAGQTREAASAYRELLASPLARDADLALRRVLWTLRDGDGLEGLWRDEYDALNGAGRTRAAAAALVERGRIERDLRGNTESAQGELSAARLLDPDRHEARVMLLALPGARPTGAEVVTLLEELAREMPAEAVSIQFLAALIADGQGHPETAQRLLREALRRAGERPSLALVRRHVASEENRSPPASDLPTLLEARAQSIALTPGADPRLSTSLFSRAAEAEEAAGRRDRAERLYRRALESEPEHLPALVRLRKLLVARGAFAEAVDVLEIEAQALRRPTRRSQALFLAATLAADRLRDGRRARGLLERAMAADSRNDAAFTRLRKLLEEANELEAVTTLLARRLAGASPEDVTALRLERVDLLLGPLGDRPAAKAELRILLESEPDNSAILGRLAALELDDGDFGAAAELSIRQARFERDPAALEACFLRIGRLYLQRLNDPRVAQGAFERVLRLTPGNREALEALSELYARQNDSRKALAVTERLVEQETDPERRLPFLIRLAALWESAGDSRRAGVIFRHAVDESPRSLQAIGELARFHDRNKEPQARKVLLEGSLSLLSADLRNNPENLNATVRTMIPILRWRQRRTSATSAAQLLRRYSPHLDESREAASWVETLSSGRRLAPLANPDLDERALPRRVQGGIRHVLRQLGPALAHANRPDLRRWQVGRSARQRPGSEIRLEFEAVAGDLGVREFDLYVSDSDPRALAVEPADPPAIVIGASLAKQGRPALRFAAGWCLRLIETHFDLLLERSPMEAAALMAGVVRRFLPDYAYPDLEDGALAAADARVGRALGKGRRAELAPFANEIAGSFTPNGLFLDAQETAARAGLLACADLASALDLIAAAAGRPSSGLADVLEIPVALRLVDFALSEDHEDLVQALDSVS